RTLARATGRGRLVGKSAAVGVASGGTKRRAGLLRVAHGIPGGRERAGVRRGYRLGLARPWLRRLLGLCPGGRGYGRGNDRARTLPLGPGRPAGPGRGGGRAADGLRGAADLRRR